MVGGNISHYRILDKIGEGGMGVVYKAEDTQLRRTVALKFLSGERLSDEENKARFLREARAAAALDHPNICHVYSIQEVDGQTFVAMAFVDGPTLTERIRERPLPIDEALAIAIQLAEGLEAAHERGVVHRDIKSSNIMLTRKKQVRILDFGLAQVAGVSRLTKTGTALGTPAYMSPEQAQGLDTDHRADIWALGIVLYEMLTGRVPFQGEREQVVLYEIISELHEPVTALRAGLPLELDRIIGKALSKNPDERFQSVTELIVDLRAVQRSEQGAARFLPPKHAESRRSDKSESVRWRPRLLAALFAGGVLSGSIATYWLTSAPRPTNHSLKIHLSFPAATSQDWGGGVPEVSPDGRRIAYVSAQEDGLERIHIRALDGPDIKVLGGTEGAYNLFWSPDGESLGFFAEGKLKRIGVSGGPADILCDAQGGPGGAWSPSGEIIFAQGTRSGLLSVPAVGGDPVDLTELDTSAGENSHRWPQFLPGGRRFLYLARAAKPEDSAIYIGSLDGGKPRRIFASQSNAVYASPVGRGLGRLLFTREGSLMAQPVEPESMEPVGEAVQVSEQVLYVPIRNLGLFSVSTDGQVLAYRAGKAEQRQLHWFNNAGSRLGSPGPPGRYDQIRLSPDGQRAALTLPDERTGKRDVWVMRLDTGALERITFDAANDWCPIWSPDGRRLIFASDRSGVSNLYLKDSLAPGEPQLVYSSAEPKFASDWSPDGAFLAYHYRKGSTIDVALLSLNGPDAIPFLTSAFVEPEAYFSPNGNWLAYASNETGAYEVYIRSHPTRNPSERSERGEKRKISSDGGTDPRWSVDSKMLFYLASDKSMMAVQFENEVSSPTKLFTSCSGGFLWDGSRQSYDVAPDGRFLMSCPVEETISSEITVVSGWQAGFATQW